MIIDASPAILRLWRRDDVRALVRLANNRKIWLNLRDRFPHPYTRADAEAWLAMRARDAGSPAQFAIEFEDALAGGVGLEFLADVNRLTVEIGYWLGEPLWRRGIATAAVRAMTAYAFKTFDLRRVQATVFQWNPASARVLEKCGYRLEGRMRDSIVKDGRVGDSLLYARLRD